jgi:ABC-2 type transport system permease protein
MKLRRINAVFKKQIKDTLKNKRILFQFIMFPIMALIITKMVPQDDPTAIKTVSAIFAVIYISMVPLSSIASIIAEEKEKNTLRALMMSNVKPAEYLIGTGGYIFVLTCIGVLFLGIIGGFAGMDLLKYIAVLFVCILASLMLGITLGILSKNQMSLAGTITPVIIILAFIPMLSLANETISAVSQILYTKQLNNLIFDLSGSNFTWDKFAIIGANMAVFFTIFWIAYKKRSLSE